MPSQGHSHAALQRHASLLDYVRVVEYGLLCIVSGGHVLQTNASVGPQGLEGRQVA